MFVQRLQHVSTTVKDSSKSCLRESYSCFVNSEKKVGRCVQAVLRSDKSKSFAAALFYGCCSISMNFLNKAVVSSFDFNFPFFIMVCQMILTVIVLDSLRLMGKLNIRPYSFHDGKEFLPASIFFALHATLSLYAIHGMNIPMYGAIKRCTPLVSLILSVLVLRKAIPSKYIVISILLITLGCLVASAGDLEFDGQAYAYGFLSVFAQGGYLTLVQRSSMEMKRSTIELIHINGFNTLPFFLIVSLCIQEPIKIANSQSFQADGFIATFVILVLSGCILTFSQFLCAAVSSALTASLVGVAKSVLQTLIGFFTFGGVPFHPLNILGLVLNMVGGMMYSWVKYHEGERKKRDKLSGDTSNPGNSDAANNEDPEAKISLLGGLRKHHMSDADLCNESAGPESDFKSKRNSNFVNLNHHQHHHQQLHKHHGAEQDVDQATTSSGNPGHPVKQNGFHLEFIAEHVKG